MTTTLRALTLLLLTATVVDAQSVDDKALYVHGYQLTADGPEKAAGVSRRVNVGAWSIGKPISAVFSMFGCGDFSVSPAPDAFADNATAGWRVEVTPVRTVNHAVTFHIRWTRALDTGKSVTPVGEDIEVTLKPGESRPLDSVAVPPTAKTHDGKPCGVKAGSLRVSVEFDTLDRRLIGADVWLVERLPNGKEDSQLQSIRTVPHRPVSVYFDSVKDGANRFDFQGNLVADLVADGIKIDVEALRARADPAQNGYQAASWFGSSIQLKPGEIVEVALTRRGESRAIDERQFVLRIQAKQIR
jgi:hypothetical protein